MIIAFDGASTALSAAIAETDGTLIAESAWSSGHRQSAELLPRILELVGASGRSVHDATAIGVGIGPGSFTGLRVALALAKGLAVGLGIPIHGVPSLGAWLAADPAARAAIARAGSRDAYVAMRDSEEVSIVDRDALGDLRDIVAPGDLAAAFGLEDARAPRAAAAIAAMTAERISHDGRGDDVGALEPIYLRAPRGVESASVERVRWL